MVSKCANPGCSAPFHYLRDGKVFRIHIDEVKAPGPQLLKAPKPVAQVEHFWLCGPCSSTLTLHVNEGKVVAVPLNAPVMRRRRLVAFFLAPPNL